LRRFCGERKGVSFEGGRERDCATRERKWVERDVRASMYAVTMVRVCEAGRVGDDGHCGEV
jgi:hypothetical protein